MHERQQTPRSHPLDVTTPPTLVCRDLSALPPRHARRGTHSAATDCPDTAREELARLGERIAALSAQIQSATYHLLVMIRDFDAGGGWQNGFRSCAHWLNWRTGLDLGAAREKVRVARALAELPSLSEAMRRGEVSFSKVRALTRVATPANEEELLAFAKAGTASHVEKLVSAWRRVDRIEDLEREGERHAGPYLRAFTDEDGMVVVQARLAPEAGAALLRALDAAGEKLYAETREQRTAAVAAGDEVSAEQRRADALGLVAESALAGGLDPGSRGDRYQVVVHVEAERLAASGAGAPSPDGEPQEDVSAETSPAPAGRPTALPFLADGPHVSAETCRRLACDCALVVMRHDGAGTVLDVGRRTRTIPPALCRALAHRDRGCRFPGCGLTLCDHHHIRHWADGGETKLENLVRLCRRHHRAVHEEGFTVEKMPGGELRFRGPDGKVFVAAPPLPPVPAETLASLTARWLREGIPSDGGASVPSWDGGPVDLGWAVDYLRRPAPRPLASGCAAGGAALGRAGKGAPATHARAARRALPPSVHAPGLAPRARP